MAEGAICVLDVKEILFVHFFFFLSLYSSLERGFVIVMWLCVKDRAALSKEPLGFESSPKDPELPRVGMGWWGGALHRIIF